jgi:Spy/CpxP family protein refolding chaperone
MKKIVMTSLLLSLLVVGGVALAQGHMGHMGMHRIPGPGPEGEAFISHIAAMLDLTQEQQDAAKQIHETMFEKSQPVMEQHHAQMEEIESLLDTGKVTAQEIGTKVIAAHATKNQLKALHEDAMAQFKALLTEEQKTKLEKMHEGMEEGHMKMRMHG